MNLRQPIWPRFLPTSTVLTLATVGPVGRLRYAPGTWGSLAGMAYQLVFFHTLSPLWVVLLSLPGLWLAVAMCGEAEFRLGRRDPGEVVLDEFVVMPFCLLGWQYVDMVLPKWAATWSVYLAAFALFRLFDITKPLWIKKVQDLPGGWGILADDLLAALLTCGVLHGIAYFLR